MKKKLALLIILTVFVTSLIAQDYAEKFGKLSQDEINLKFVTWDPSAEAVVLFDYGTACFIEEDNGMEILFKRTTRIKVFNDAGLSYANIEIPFYFDESKSETIRNIDVNIYNMENGVMAKSTIDKINYYDEKLNERWKLRKFAIPNVKAGSIIEYQYTVQSPFIFNLPDWNFQWRIPVLYSEYMVKQVPFYEYQFIVQGVSKLDVFESYQDPGLPRQYGIQAFNDMVHRYGLRNIPAFRDEEFITSMNDYIIKIDFQLCQINKLNGSKIAIITTWPELIKELTKDSRFGKYIDKSENMAEKLFNVKDVLLKSEKERFEFVINFVKNNYKWNGNNYLYAYNSVNDLIDKNQGSSAEINLFLIGLLKAVNIDVLPVISSTREHGKIRADFPFFDFFNYVMSVVNVDGKNVLVDATDLNCPNQRIPFRCINDKGLVVKKDEVSWLGLQSRFPSTTMTTLELSVSDSLITSEIETSSNEYDAMLNRAKYSKDSTKILSELNRKTYDVVDQSLVIKNSTEINLPYTIGFKSINKTNIIGGKIYVSPFLNEAISENPLKQAKGTYPVDMAYPKRRVLNSTITIPEGYKVDYVGGNLSFQNKLYDIDYKIEVADRQVFVKMVYSFKMSVYPTEDYDKLQYYFNEIIEKANQKVVFVKI